MRVVPQVSRDFQMNEKNYSRRATSLDKFMMCEDDGVFYIGHASALIRLNGKLIMFDPIWNHKPYGDYWTFYPEQVNCDEILHKIDAVFISHIHEDHVCDPILKKLGPKCEVYIMNGRPNLERRLDRNLSICEPLKWFFVGHQSVEAMFIPHAFNSIDSSVFIKSDKFCVYIGSDNFLDARLLDKVGTMMRGQTCNVAMVPYAFIHWYPRCMNIPDEEKRDEITRLNYQSLEQAIDFMRVVRPLEVVPFGNNLMYTDNSLNAQISRPDHFIKEPMVTGDFYLRDIGKYRSDHASQFFPIALPKVDPQVHIEGWMLEEIRDKVKRAPNFIPNHELIVNDIVIDLEQLKVSVRFGDGEKPSTRFDFDKKEFNQWVQGDITFEQAIGTRRFICTRTPNRYNLQVFEFMNNYL